MKNQLTTLVLCFLAMMAIINIPPVSADLSDGLMAYYPFDGTAEDMSGNDNDGIEEGGVVYKMGIKGESASFDGVDDYIRVPYDPTLNPVSQLTISFWVKVEGYTNTWSPLIHKGGSKLQDYANREYTVWLKNTSEFLLDSAADNSGRHYCFACCAAVGWTHYVAIIDRLNHRMQVYIDGILKTDVNDSYSTFNNNDRDMLIGWSEEVSSYYSPFKGRIDELRIYDRGLAEDEIKALYGAYSSTYTYSFTINDDGNARKVTPFSSEESANQYYNYFSASGHPDFGPEQNVAFFWLWKEVDTGILSLNVIFSREDSTSPGAGRAYFTLSGVPQVWTWALQDDDGDIGGLHDDTPSWGWNDTNTDGGIIRGLQGSEWDFIWTANANSDYFYGINEWYFLSSDTDKKTNSFLLLPEDKLTISSKVFAPVTITGKSLQVLANIEFILEQNSQQDFQVQITNPTEEPQSVSLEIINPNPELTATISQVNPVEVAAGAALDISVLINTNKTPVSIYDNLLLKLTAANGETLYSNLTITVTAPGEADSPDLSVKAADIGLADYTFGESATLEAVVHNNGTATAENIQVQFYEFGTLLGETVLGSLPANETATVSITAPIITSGEHLIQVTVDGDDTIAELNEWNNEANQIIKIGTPPPVPGSLLVTGSLPSTVYTGELFTVSGRVVYDIYVDGVRYTNYVVKGGLVQITISDVSGGEWIYGDIHTDINGRFSKRLQAPATVDSYHVTMTVSDGTLFGKRNLIFSTEDRPPVPPAPPLPPVSYGPGSWTPGSVSGSWVWTPAPDYTPPPYTPHPDTSDLRVFSKNIHFSSFNPQPGEDTTIFTEINYWATNSDLLATDIPVNFYVTYPGSPKMKIDETLINSLSVGAPDFGSRYVYTSWQGQDEGIHIIEVEIDPSYMEEYMGNNAATRAILIGGLASFEGAITGQVSNAWGGVAGVLIELYDTAGTMLENQLTDSNGSYLFLEVPVDEYQVRITAPENYLPDSEIKSAQVLDQQVTEVNFLLTAMEYPVADAGGPYTGMVGDVIILDAGASVDPDGEIVLYEWDMNNDGLYDLNGTTPVLEHIFTAPVNGEIRVQVTDNDGLRATATAQADINLCGDLDHDGDVDGDDRNILRYALGTGEGDVGFVPEADYDDDGLISYNDYREWYACYSAFIDQ